jgi:16S rRNA (cytidine1402-2'-O)-methyltransferase
MVEKKTQQGQLYLLPSSLGGENVPDILPEANIRIMNQLDEFIVENLRTARRFLRAAGFKESFDNIRFHLLNKHTAESEISGFLASANEGKNVGLLSEAGCPCIADPGQQVVRLAHKLDIRVIPLVGPSSILLALMASGFNGQRFAFYGYLPIDSKQRSHTLQELEKQAYKADQTQVFMETPFRNEQLFEAIISSCRSETLLCIALDLTTSNEFIKTLPVGLWKKEKPVLHKRTGIFLLYHP